MIILVIEGKNAKRGLKGHATLLHAADLVIDRGVVVKDKHATVPRKINMNDATEVAALIASCDQRRS